MNEKTKIRKNKLLSRQGKLTLEIRKLDARSECQEFISLESAKTNEINVEIKVLMKFKNIYFIYLFVLGRDSLFLFNIFKRFMAFDCAGINKAHIRFPESTY